MIAAGEPREFSPFGREHVRSYHPGKGCSSAAPTCADKSALKDPHLHKIDISVPDSWANTTTKGGCVPMRGTSLQGNETWHLKEGKDGSEEELYIFGHAVVWSKNNGCGMFKMQKTFTMDSPVKQALWCDTFRNTSVSNRKDVECGAPLGPSICILDTSTIHVINEAGHVFSTPLPFQVSRIWNSQFGVIIERKPVLPEDGILQRNDWDNFPLVFNLLYPHDDITPIVMSRGKLSYFLDAKEEIIFSSKSPSVLVTHNKASKCHNVWKVRSTTKEEQDITGDRVTNASQLRTSSILLEVSPISYLTGSNSSKTSSESGSRTKYSHLTFTPTQSFAGSPKHLKMIGRTPSYSEHSSPTSKVSSPLVSNLTHMATLSRSQSPSVSGASSATHHRLNFASPLGSNRAGVAFSPRASQHLSGQFSESFMYEVGVPIIPDLCFEHVWTDRYLSPNQSEKVFFTSDISGHNFLCLFLKEEKLLRFIKIEESNNMEKLIFGSVSVISARDVEPVKALNMLFILDEMSTFSLYTGPIKVCKVHIPGTLGMVDVLPSVSRWRDSLLSGTPRRSSLAAVAKTQNALEVKFQEKFQMLSPVAAHTETSANDYSFLEESFSSIISQLRDGTNYSITMKTNANEYFKITLPKLSSSDIVSKILGALKSVLPRDVASQILLKWYTIRNAPGPCDSTAQTELVCFFQCLLGMLGYDVEASNVSDGLSESDWSASPVEKKKFKNSEKGHDEDFNYLVSSRYERPLSLEMKRLNLNINNGRMKKFPLQSHCSSINTSSPIYIYLPSILFTLHLIYEDMKLSTLECETLPLIARVLYQLAGSLFLNEYQDHYWRDVPDALPPEEADTYFDSLDHGNENVSIQIPSNFPLSPPNIYGWLLDCISQKPLAPFPYIPRVTTNIKNIILLFYYLKDDDTLKQLNPERFLTKVLASGARKQEELEPLLALMQKQHHFSLEERIVELLSYLQSSVEDLDNVPFGISLPIQGAIFHCRKNPPPDWPKEAYNLIRRQELTVLTHETAPSFRRPSSNSPVVDKKGSSTNKEEDDGFDHLDQAVLNLRFSKDQRIQDVCRMLQSSTPVRVSVVQRPEVSDHEFLEEQEKYLYTLCIRTMALPTGRGMFTLRTCMPVVTETLPIPKLCITGRAPPRNNSIELTHIDVPSNMNMWPLFHNGVAAGLRIAPGASEIHSTWIVYNKPKSTNSTDSPTEHAGFLMGLGLNGHLKNLTTMSVHDYLCKNQELTSVGLLLGLAASKLGTMDVATTKIMSIHLEALLPPTSTELDVPPMLQVAAVLGVGLLYQGSVHRHIAEVLLGEIGRPPGPEMEHCVDRESYALASGLALGLVTLGNGSEVAALSDLPIADQLYHFMVGGHKRPLTGIHKEKQKSPSYQIREGDSVNVDVTSPGATLALGMMFFDTGNRAIAEWMEVPDTQYLLDMVRPDFLMLRTISHSLILWDEVLPSKSWVECHLPLIVSTHALKKGQISSDVDYETMSQAYCNVVAGACMSLGLKFAGSANEEAFETLFHYARMFLSLSSKPVAEQAGKSTIETCLNVAVLSLAMVMTGTGDLEVLRLCRHLRSRVSHASSYVQYGSHMSTHMALGLLFLGGGRFTLKTTPGAIGALLCAFFPKFPTHSNDNRYHLQAFRHLYALAVEPRIIIPRDIDTGKVVYTHLKMLFKDTNRYTGSHYTVKAPCILPELSNLKEVIVEDSRYWPIIFNHEQNWKCLRILLERDGYIYVKQKAGCLPYTEDPKGFRSALSQCIMQDTVHGWSVKPTAMTTFSSDPLVLNFSSVFLLPHSKIVHESELQKQLCALLFECATKEKTEAFPIYLQLVQLLSSSSSYLCLGYKQLNLLLEYQCRFPNRTSLVNPDYITSLKTAIEQDVTTKASGVLPALGKYLKGNCPGYNPDLASFLVFYNIPHLKLEPKLTNSLPGLYKQFQHMKIPLNALKTLMSSLKI